MTQCLRAVAMTRCNRTRQSLTKLRREPSRRDLTRQPNEENKMSLGTILLIILVLLLVGIILLVLGKLESRHGWRAHVLASHRSVVASAHRTSLGTESEQVE